MDSQQQRKVKRNESLPFTNSPKKIGSETGLEIVQDWCQKPAVWGIFVIFTVLPLLLTYNSVFQPLDEVASEIPSGSIVENATRRTSDTTLGGLLPPLELYAGDRKCISRTQEYWLRNASNYQPSAYLIAKLRGYEQRHRKCVEVAERFGQGAAPEELGDCRFAVWIVNDNGLGNRIISLVSSFVYALVTNRVLLLAPGNQIDKLLCEPFPATSWLLPDQVAFDWESITHPNSTGRFGSLVQNGYVTKSEDGNVFANLFHNYNQNDSRFFCEFSQDYLEETPWLFLMSDLYFAPALHFVPRFHAELDKMFPERETLFHHVSRYLLHPSDSVWEIILPFYNAYLSNAQRKVGLQVRILNPSNVTIPLETKQIISCVLGSKLLPNVTRDQEREEQADPYHNENENENENSTSSVSIVVTSLHKEFYEAMRQFYEGNAATESGHIVDVHTPSYEGMQMSNSVEHNKIAFADIYILSFSDALLTSPWSTFGYVAQGIAGVTPWILTKTRDRTAAEFEEDIRVNGNCNLGESLEPCLHVPPKMDCEYKGWYPNAATILPFIKTCEDVSWGVKIFDQR